MDYLYNFFKIIRKNLFTDRRLSDLELRRPNVLFVTSNGAGMGHLTRISAIAKALEHTDHHILTMSTGIAHTDLPSTKAGYFPSYGALGMSSREWNKALANQLDSLIRVYKPNLIVFDGTYVYSSVTKMARRWKVPLWWLQRGSWKSAVDQSSKQRHNAASVCDLVVVPEDYGVEEIVDSGPGIEQVKVSPIVLNYAMHSQFQTDQHRDELLSKLNLAPDRFYVLIQLGAGNINDTQKSIETSISSVLSLGSKWDVVLLRNPISKREFDSSTDSNRIHIKNLYPMTEFFDAFEFAILAAGYNSVQEAIGFGLPAVFVPNINTQTDDQARRSQGAQSKGFGLSADNEFALKAKITEISNPSLRNSIRVATSTVQRPNGAIELASLIDSFCGETEATFRSNPKN